MAKYCSREGMFCDLATHSGNCGITACSRHQTYQASNKTIFTCKVIKSPCDKAFQDGSCNFTYCQFYEGPTKRHTCPNCGYNFEEKT